METKVTKNPAVGGKALRDGLGAESNAQTKRIWKREKEKKGKPRNAWCVEREVTLLKAMTTSCCWLRLSSWKIYEDTKRNFYVEQVSFDKEVGWEWMRQRARQIMRNGRKSVGEKRSEVLACNRKKTHWKQLFFSRWFDIVSHLSQIRLKRIRLSKIDDLSATFN